MPANINAEAQSTVSAEEYYVLMTEVRDLKNTVAALRSAFEQEKIDKEKTVQAAHAAALVVQSFVAQNR